MIHYSPSAYIQYGKMSYEFQDGIIILYPNVSKELECKLYIALSLYKQALLTSKSEFVAE